MLNPPPPAITLLQQYLAASDRVSFLRRKDDVELKKLFDEVTRALIDIAVEARGVAVDKVNE
jgi:hypothetical protein